MEIELSDELTIKEFNKIKKEIENKIKEIFPEIERIIITSLTKKQ